MQANGNTNGKSANLPSTRSNGTHAHNNSDQGEDSNHTNRALFKEMFKDREGRRNSSVGNNYQANISRLIPKDDRNFKGEHEKSLVMWEPTDKLSDAEIERYISTSKNKYNYTEEQALGILYWNRYNLDKASQDVAKFTSPSEEWTKEDKTLFHEAYHYHGKNFEKIRQVLPDKSMSNIVKYYYLWKKDRYKSSAMDAKVKKFSKYCKEGPKTAPNNVNSENGSKQVRGQCKNCRVSCERVFGEGNLCLSCYTYRTQTGTNKPIKSGPQWKTSRGVERSPNTPPKGMHIDTNDLKKFAKSNPRGDDTSLKDLSKQVVDLKIQVQRLKQSVELLRRGLPKEGLSNLRPK